MQERIGIIGLGRMGRAMADRLAGQGLPITGWTRSGADPGVPGLTCAATLDHAVEASDILLLSLFDDRAVRDMLVRLAAHAIEVAGGRLIDAPISGGPEMVVAGTIGIYLGGAHEDLARFRPLADRLSSRVVPVGALGAGHAAKIVNNAAMGGAWQAMIESFRLGARLGLDLETMLGIMERSPATPPAFRDRIPKMRGEDHSVGFSVAGVVKDQTLFLAVAEAAGVSLPALTAARENFRAAAEAGHADDDLAMVIPVRTAAP
jgi:3-hydroxyisobutyrate dehydrogenase